MNQSAALITLVVIDLVSYALLGVAAWHVHRGDKQKFWMSVAVGVLGVVVGWLIGFLASPSDSEIDRFSTYAGFIATFATGYLVSKLDPLLTKILATPERLATTVIALNLLVFTSCLVSGVLIMYMTRSYLS